MTQVASVFTRIQESRPAGMELGQGVLRQLHGERPDVVIVFCSSSHDYGQLLRGLQETCRPALQVGCSSAGEFTAHEAGAGTACVLGLRATGIAFHASLGTDLAADPRAAARAVAAGFAGAGRHRHPYRSALLLVDALAGYTEEVIEELSIATGGDYQFFGGGAGDDARFQRTHVFLGTEAYTDAVVALEILSAKPVGIGVRHGWEPASKPMRVTEASGSRLFSLNSIPAVDQFRAHAERLGQRFDPADPRPFFLHNILGIDSGRSFKLRVPLALHPDGSVSCAAPVPAGATVCIMRATGVSAAKAAADAVASALEQMGGNRSAASLVFDCAATRLRLGSEFAGELDAVQVALGGTPFVGCNTYGQIARVESQFSGFHNCTAVVCVLPD